MQKIIDFFRSMFLVATVEDALRPLTRIKDNLERVSAQHDRLSAYKKESIRRLNIEVGGA